MEGSAPAPQEGEGSVEPTGTAGHRNKHGDQAFLRHFRNIESCFRMLLRVESAHDPINDDALAAVAT